MSRPCLTIGAYGEITTSRRPSGRIEARARCRDWDGVARLVQVSGDTAGPLPTHLEPSESTGT